MKALYKNPEWIDTRLLKDWKLDGIPESFFEEINAGLNVLQKGNPLVSIVIPVFNEEVTILRTLHSLSQNQTEYPVEIIVVNNNSTDRTQEVLSKLNVKTYVQPVPGWGPARQMGQEEALGKYILMADADCFYPPKWIERMSEELQKEGVTCVYGGYSFLGTKEDPRWHFVLYEVLRNIVSELRHLNRPYLNARGMSMGFIKELGLKKGFINKKMRGEDGRMCFELMQFGKVVRIRSRAVAVWTFPRTLQKDGSLMKSIVNRALIELSRLKGYFYKLPLHDTHTSQNTEAFMKSSQKRDTMDLEKEMDEVKL